MQYIQHDLGNRKSGETVEVTLDNAANVRLLDNANFQAYRNGRRHRYQGGLARKSPIHLQIPRSGRWFVVVDMVGLRGQVKSSARILPGPLPQMSETPLSQIPSLRLDSDEAGPSATSNETYDVFICHASEDKSEVARPLAKALESHNMKVWYDDFQLKIGSSLRKSIDTGISKSRFGIIVISETFFAKGWPQYELDGIVSRTVSGQQNILPIWHNITKQQIVEKSPSLADKVARSTSTSTIQEIADEIFDVVSS